MSLPVFRAAPLPPPGVYRLGGAAGRHAATVRRIRPGESIRLVDGRGASALAVVTAASREGLDLAVAEPTLEPASDPRLVVVQALAKGDRGELAVELLTEIGADEIVPWGAARSVVRWDPQRAERGVARWQRVADAAAEQSRRAWWPLVAPLAQSADVAARIAAADLAAVLSAESTEPLTALTVPATGEIVVVVGPEGGLDDAETAAFVTAGARCVRLGREVLRTSSAGIAASAALLAPSRWARTAG